MLGLPPEALTPLGALCLVLALPYLLIALGRLVTRKTVQDMIADHEREMAAVERDHEREIEAVQHDRDEWRAEGRIKDQHIAELQEQNVILLREISPLLAGFLEALRAAGVAPRGSDERAQ